MIRNTDGTPYSSAGQFKQFDPESKEHDLFNSWDQEIIQIGGSPIFYFDVIIPVSNIDTLYLEARDKIYSNHPVQLYCFYEPVPSLNEHGLFGIDGGMESMIFEFNYRDVLNKIGFPPKIGARLYTPHLKENWVVVQRNLGEFKKWGALRLQIIANKFQESTSTGSGKVTEKKVDFEIN